MNRYRIEFFLEFRIIEFSIQRQPSCIGECARRNDTRQIPEHFSLTIKTNYTRVNVELQSCFFILSLELIKRNGRQSKILG